jgi:hypothetical protein
MPTELLVRVQNKTDPVDVPAVLLAAAAGGDPASSLDVAARQGPRLLLTGDRDYLVGFPMALSADLIRLFQEAEGKSVHIIFPGRRPVRRRLHALLGLDIPVTESGVALDLTQGREGARPLWLLPDGTFSITPSAPLPGPSAVSFGPESAPGIAAADALVAAARWISSRRSATFECLFPPSAFHPDQPVREERLSEAQAKKLLSQLQGALREAAVGGAEAERDATGAAQVRSAALTVLSHLVATANNDASFRAVADAAAAEIFALIDAEQGHATARGALRAHAIQLLQLRGPALRKDDKDRARQLLRGLLRAAPPYDELTGPWRFAMCSAHDFHEGECQILTGTYNFTEIPVPEGAPKPPGIKGYRAFEAPFKTPHGQPIQVFARSASPSNENFEMGEAFFTGILINRHAQLGSYDMRAASVAVSQEGYKLMMNSQCAGLTTRFAISRMFPDADIYSSWDSTYFRAPSGRVVASEGLDCFIALLRGMMERDDHAGLEQRMKRVEWHHEAASIPGFVQFVGPANPLVVSRFNDVNLDGRADLYDGFLDFHLTDIAEDLRASMEPRDPGVAATQISGEAATGLNWAAGSLNRVTQYSDLWAALPGESELLYIFQSGGFYSQSEPPDVKGGPLSALRQDPSKLPAVCSYQKSEHTASGLLCEVIFHSHLSHAASELKRLLCAADAFWRAIDLGYLPKEGPLATIEGQRGAVLLLLAGLLEFPADQNFIDGLWSMALSALNFPEISRSVVRACNTEEDHDASNYYGSKRGVRQLIGDGKKKGAIEAADPVAMEKLRSEDPRVGRAGEIDF